MVETDQVRTFLEFIKVSTDRLAGGVQPKESSTITKSQKSTSSKSLEFFEIPTKYRRRPLTQDEIDLITVRNFDFTIDFRSFSFRLAAQHAEQSLTK